VYTRHIEAAWDARVGGRAKPVLLAYAHHACQHCGLAWPGIPRVAERCEKGVNSVREIVAQLVKDGHLELFSHPRGGKGCTTIYRVLPGPVACDRAPCEQCWVNLRLTPKGRAAGGPQVLELGLETPEEKPSPRGAGNDELSTAGNPPPGAWVSGKPSPRGAGNETPANPPPGGGVSGLPSGFGRKTLPPGVRRTVSNDEQSTRARVREAAAAPPRSDSPDPRPPAPKFTDTLRQLGLTPRPSLDAVALDLANAVTAPDKGKAQPSGHARNGAQRRGRTTAAVATGDQTHEDDG
jgi:hypothetical protein